VLVKKFHDVSESAILLESGVLYRIYRGFMKPPKRWWFNKLVEAAGIEPASENPRPLVLHA